MDGWTDTHVTYINRSMRVAHVCVLATYRLHGALYYSKFRRKRAPNSNTGKLAIFNSKATESIDLL
jgi:hypothetical protein